jgi:cell division protein ZapE
MKLDSNQIKIKKELEILAQKIKKNAQKKLLHKIFKKDEKILSHYIYGDVGRGKTMLMRNFFNSLPKVKKSYFHFNSFMNLIHENLRDIRAQKLKVKDELIAAVDRIIKGEKLICFDEFQVVDIADAMLLSRIFSHIFAKNIIVVFTSNTSPQNLYKNGLQRELFLEFVNKILLKNIEIFCLDSEIDYRKKLSDNLEEKYFLNNKKDCKKIRKLVKNFSEKEPLQIIKIKVWGREIKIKHANSKIAIFNCQELIFANYAASDYRAICQKFSLIFLLNLPQFKAEDVNEIRRFTLFIDEIYENKTALIIQSQIKIDKIYNNTKNISYAPRTISRLQEIKSQLYWQNSKIN